MVAIFRVEMLTYRVTPTGYVFMGFFLLVSGFLVSARDFIPGNPAYTDVLLGITSIFLIAIPILTMRLFSDEKKQRTDILLLTKPIPVGAIVLGKFLAAESVFAATLGVTALFPLIMSFHGSIAGWEILGSYIGFFFLGSCFIALGLCISSLTENQGKVLGVLELENFTITDLSLLTDLDALADYGLVIINAPTRDITAAEADEISDHLLSGGSGLFLVGPIAGGAPNLDRVLPEFGGPYTVAAAATLVIDPANDIRGRLVVIGSGAITDATLVRDVPSNLDLLIDRGDPHATACLRGWNRCLAETQRPSREQTALPFVHQRRGEIRRRKG